MDSDAGGQPDLVAGRERQPGDELHKSEAGQYGAQGVIFVARGWPK
jgi:hypothetical protein